MAFCQRCGVALVDGSAFCAGCGTPVKVFAPAQAVPANVAPPMPQVYARGAAYAGFWLRVVAYLIDGLVLGVVAWLVIWIMILAAGASVLGGGASPAAVGLSVSILFIGICMLVPLEWLYFALLESSSWQATLGKKALSLYVTDLNGQPIGFGRATGRFFGKILSGMILYIGFMMAGFTEKKQALHDMLASTLVMRR